MKCASTADATVRYEVHINWTCSDEDVLREGLSHHLRYPNAKRLHMHCVTPSFGLEFLPTIGGMKAADGDVTTPR